MWQGINIAYVNSHKTMAREIYETSISRVQEKHLLETGGHIARISTTGCTCCGISIWVWSLGAKADRRLSPTPNTPPTPSFLLHITPSKNRWLLPCHRWNYVAMVFWPMKWHFQERSQPLSPSFFLSHTEWSSLLSKNPNNTPPVTTSRLPPLFVKWAAVRRLHTLSEQICIPAHPSFGTKTHSHNLSVWMQRLWEVSCTAYEIGRGRFKVKNFPDLVYC